MNFCNQCNNMFYIKIHDDDCNQITYYCRNCGNTDNSLMNTGKCIIKEVINNSTNNQISLINKYTKLDNTLPRINNIKCPNETCISNTAEFDIDDREIIYIRYDNINMKYVYLCSHCDNTWKVEK